MWKKYAYPALKESPGRWTGNKIIFKGGPVKESYIDASEMYLYEVIYICSNWLVFDQRASIACSVQKA